MRERKRKNICLTRKVITKFWFSTSCLGHVDYSSADSSTYFKVYAHHSRWHFISSELCTTTTWSIECPDALCPVSCSVGTWVVLCLASGTIFFTVISCKGWCYDQTVHIGEIQLVTLNLKVYGDSVGGAGGYLAVGHQRYAFSSLNLIHSYSHNEVTRTTWEPM